MSSPQPQYASHGQAAVRRSLFVDVSDLAASDRGTGIQRVTKAIVSSWLHHQPPGYAVIPVYLDPIAGNYRVAGNVGEALLGAAWEAPSADNACWCEGDIFVGLDLMSLNPSLVSDATRLLFRSLRQRGVAVWFVVYDLLPVQLPHYFPPEPHHQNFVAWLHIVADASGVACISNATALDFRRWMSAAGLLRSDFQVRAFHLGAEPAHPSFSQGLPPDSRDMLKVLKSRPSFLVVGTIEPRKGHRQALAAFESLWRKGIEVNLVFVGQAGWLVDSLLERIRSHPQLGHRLFWPQAVSDEYLIGIYESSTCLLACSEAEGFGLPTIEAARMGVPIIARDIPVNREVCGEFAAYFSGNEPEELEAAVTQWLQSWTAGAIPDSTGMPVMTWREVASSLMRIVSIDESGK